ncbi:hypothetical protein D3C72_2140410 [compost metagenome]
MATLIMNCRMQTAASTMPVKPGGISFWMRICSGSSTKCPSAHSTIDMAKAKAQLADRQYSAISGHSRRWRQIQIERTFFMNTSAPPWAQRSRCLNRPRMVSGIRIQHSARGS